MYLRVCVLRVRVSAIFINGLGGLVKLNSMAKKNNTKGSGSSFFSSIGENVRKVRDFFRNHNVQFVLGLLCAAFAIFLCSSFVSFFSTGGSDQTALESVVSVAGEVAEKVENTSGRSGAVVADYLINGCFGWASMLLLPLLMLVAVRLMRLMRVNLLKWTYYALFTMVWLSVFFASVFGDSFGVGYVSPGGKHGVFLRDVLNDAVGIVGLVLLLMVSLLIFMITVSRKTVVWLRRRLSFASDEEEDGVEPAQNVAAAVVEQGVVADVPSENGVDYEFVPSEDAEDADEVPGDADDVAVESEELLEIDIDGEDEDVSAEEVLEIDEVTEDDILDDDELAAKFDKMSHTLGTIRTEEGDLDMEVERADGDDDMGGDMLRPINPKDELSYYKPPTLDLLEEYEQAVQSIDKNEQAANANKIVEVLKNFGIDISSIKATVGPTITLYEITPAPGVRISKIRNLEDDIAMSLSALCIRIVAPIPGKGTIGIEVPNAHKQIVPMASLLNSRKYKETDMALPLALGKTISNEVYMVDMAKMPHLLVAGATGMGKSVGLNAIITSLLYKMHPAYLKFVMVDPKMVELSLYGVLEKHFLAKLEGEDEPIITDVHKVVRTLKSLCVEMDNRYKLLQLASVRSVEEYNKKYLNKELLPTKGHRFMPYIVVIIDEYGDLMMTAGREVEQPIARIAQKARAVGIHMIIATQRPTTNIITGTIKANFPARMAFRVISVIDSRTILDRSGANQLQGRGDMLFLAGNDPVRVQCALVETKEVERVCAHIAKQQGYQTAYILPEPDEAGDFGVDGGSGGAVRGEISSDKLDPLFAEAARVVVLAQHGSTSLIQRKFNVGFNRAGRIMDQLCQTGIVGEQEGSKPRQVLCADEADLEFRLKALL